jgi:DNA-binding NarL/FixJ family response regulator
MILDCPRRSGDTLSVAELLHEPLRILLVDDHKIMRAGIKAILEQCQEEQCQEFAVIGEAADGGEAVAECNQKHPDLIVMDIGLPGMNGIETTQIVLRNSPVTKVVMLSIYSDEHTVVNAIRAGANAYVLKKASGSDLLKAIRTVAKGGCYLSPQVSDYLFRRLKGVGPETTLATSGVEILAPRELQVLQLVAAGNSSKEIAGILGLEPATVLTYRKTMMRKLGIKNVAACVLQVHLAHFVGLVGPTLSP